MFDPYVGTSLETDWGAVFRNVIAYGATQFANPQSTARLYSSNMVNYQVNPDGSSYIIGRNNDTGVMPYPVNNGIPPALLFLGLGVLIYMVAKG